MKFKFLFMCLLLFVILIFFIWINLTFFWVFIAFVVSFAYFVILKNWVQIEIELEKEVLHENNINY